MPYQIRFPFKGVDSKGSPYVTFTFKRPDGSKTGTAIVLFMPPAFQINDGHEWEFASKGLLGSIKSAFEDIGNDKGEGLFRGVVGWAMTHIPGLQSDYAQGLAGAGQAVRDPKFFNYKEPKAREFTFTYKFEPKNAQDAGMMMQAIRTFRTASYPTALPGGRMYGVPDSVTVNFGFVKTSLSNELPGLVIKEMSTSLSEGEQMLTFEDGIPTQVSLNITLAESTLLTKTSSGDLGYDTQVGGARAN